MRSCAFLSEAGLCNASRRGGLILLRTKKYEPNDRHGSNGDTDAHDEEQQNGRARLGLSGFGCRFNDNAVLFFSHNHLLDFRCQVSAVEYRHRLDILRKFPGRGIFRGMAQGLAGCIQAIRGFVCTTTGIMRPWRNLISCVGKSRGFVHALILCWRPNRPRRDGSYSCRFTGKATSPWLAAAQWLRRALLLMVR